MTQPESTEPPKPKRTPSMLGFCGWLIVAIAFTIGCGLIIAEAVFFQGNPYTALITYMVIPAVIGFGFSLVGLGAGIRWYKRRKYGKQAPPLPVLDLNSARTRRTILIGLALATGFLAISGIGGYRAYQYTESTGFCGTVCHRVMQPEYEAHQISPHARVKCVECHIGPGAGWYVKSKLSGMRQAVNIAFGSYELPIETPLKNLRPARDTCEECHWPAKFSGSVERVQYHYWYDEESTPSRYHLLMRVGGVNPASGRPEGIHWHSDSRLTVRYWARDRERLDIPWVEVEADDGTTTVFSVPELTELPEDAELRTMDCMDCHNRPAHVFRSPSSLVNLALSEGTLDRSLPYAKKNAVEILSVAYPDRPIARERIEAQVVARYPAVGAESRQRISETLIDLYDRSHYPDQGVSWRTYPNHIGHRVFPGCFRCHDENHRSPTGKTISQRCDLCHDFVHQAYGADADGPVSYRTQPFEHPGGQGDMHQLGTCTECHASDVEYPGH